MSTINVICVILNFNANLHRLILRIHTVQRETTHAACQLTGVLVFQTGVALIVKVHFLLCVLAYLMYNLL